MLRFCATIHPVWARVMKRHPRARGLAFADDGFVRSSIVDCLHIWAELKGGFKDDLNLDTCLPKCRLYIKGLTLEEAREEVRKLLEANPELQGLKDILEIHDDPANNVVQVDGMVCVGVPIGSPALCMLSLPTKPGKWFRTSRSCRY